MSRHFLLDRGELTFFATELGVKKPQILKASSVEELGQQIKDCISGGEWELTSEIASTSPLRPFFPEQFSKVVEIVSNRDT